MIRGLLLDLDDTLYEYAPCERAAREALFARTHALFGTPREAFEARFSAARKSVKDRCDTPSGHGRLLYVTELLHGLFEATGARDASPLAHARELEEAYWSAYLDTMELRPFAHGLLDELRARGMKIAIVTDLTLDIQLQKLAKLDLFRRIDALVASEEVGADKPARAAFALGAARLGVPLEACAVVGDNVEKDGAGAEALGIPYFRARTLAVGEGLTLEEIFDALVRRNGWTR